MLFLLLTNILTQTPIEFEHFLIHLDSGLKLRNADAFLQVRQPLHIVLVRINESLFTNCGILSISAISLILYSVQTCTSSAFQSSIVRVSVDIFTPTFNRRILFVTSAVSNLYGIRYPLSSICFSATSAELSTLNSKT